MKGTLQLHLQILILQGAMHHELNGDFWDPRVLPGIPEFYGTELMKSKGYEGNLTCIICAGWCWEFFFLKTTGGSMVKIFASKLV